MNPLDRIHELYLLDEQLCELIKSNIPDEFEDDILTWKWRIQEVIEGADIKRIAAINNEDYKLFDWLYQNRYLLPDFVKDELGAWEGRLLDVWSMTEPFRDKKPLELPGFNRQDLFDSLINILKPVKL
jgi:hypothetical protein